MGHLEDWQTEKATLHRTTTFQSQENTFHTSAIFKGRANGQCETYQRQLMRGLAVIALRDLAHQIGDLRQHDVIPIQRFRGQRTHQPSSVMRTMKRTTQRRRSGRGTRECEAPTTGCGLVHVASYSVRCLAPNCHLRRPTNVPYHGTSERQGVLRGEVQERLPQDGEPSIDLSLCRSLCRTGAKKFL